MNVESSRTHVSVTVFGSARWIDAIFARTPSITATVFSPIARRMSSCTAGLSPNPTADVGHTDRRAVLRGDDDVVEILGGVDPAERPQQQLALALLHGAAGNLDVL